MHGLLKRLQDGRFHSGEALASLAGLSRMAIWKRLQQLEQELGLELHSVRGKGYRLAEPLSLLDRERLASQVRWPLDLHLELDSTSAEAMRQLQAGRKPPFAVLAERQSAGRGRRGRQWISPFGRNLYFSLVWPVEGGTRELEGLSLVAGLAVREALQAAGLGNAALKWPNDVLVRGRKIAGILLELLGDPADSCQVIIGIGLNVNMLQPPEPIDQPWTSLQRETGERADRTLLCSRLCDALAHWLVRHRQQGFAALRPEWEQAHAWQGCQVQLSSATRTVSGRVLGVTDQGALRLDVNGREQLFSGGELSLRLSDDS